MIAILGESASGKSTLQNDFIKAHPEYAKVVLFTTRPPRKDEKDGRDYHFVSKPAFNRLVKSGFFATVEQYNDWYYGIPKGDCAGEKTVIIVNPCAWRKLQKQGFEMTSIYLYVDRRSRLINILLRGDDIEEAYRRNLTEVGQFDGVSFESDYVIANSEYHMNREQVVKCMEEILETNNNSKDMGETNE